MKRPVIGTLIAGKAKKAVVQVVEAIEGLVKAGRRTLGDPWYSDDERKGAVNAQGRPNASAAWPTGIACSARDAMRGAGWVPKWPDWLDRWR
jgi:hypothetical protein